MNINRKQIKIEILDSSYGYLNKTKSGENNILGYDYPRLYPTEYNHIYLDHEITEEDFEKCINTLATYFMQKQLNMILINLDEKNKGMRPVKEMTIEEIEDKLDCKIKIINKEEK